MSHTRTTTTSTRQHHSPLGSPHLGALPGGGGVSALFASVSLEPSTPPIIPGVSAFREPLFLGSALSENPPESPKNRERAEDATRRAAEHGMMHPHPWEAEHG